MIGKAIQLYQWMWMFEANRQQALTWDDAALARLARDRTEVIAQAQADAMLDAHPSGQLGRSQLDDEDGLKRAGLL